jgi:exopolysaccharide production protein ExoQ
MTSWTLWIPLLWILIAGSRPVSLWFGEGTRLETYADHLEGSPLDRAVFGLLIIAGSLVLLRRRMNWGEIFASNRWVWAFFFYCGVSVIWSDHPFVGFKRWTKDLGNVIMALVILTENDPVQATKAVFTRCIYILVPLSVLFIKYFPDMGRYYDKWTWQVVYGGVTINKNALGFILFIGGMFLIWDFIEKCANSSVKDDKLDFAARILLLGSVIWLIDKARSSTALGCLLLGVALIFIIQRPISRKYFSLCCLATGLFILFLLTFPGVLDAFFLMVGRDSTLTGRSDIWAQLMREPVNPIFGAGYQSFWLNPATEHYRLNQSHNGYLETYLNSGLVGVFLLISMLASTAEKLKKGILDGNSYAIFLFSIFVAGMVYNWTEAIFNFLNIVWFALLIVAMTHLKQADEGI